MSIPRGLSQSVQWNPEGNTDCFVFPTFTRENQLEDPLRLIVRSRETLSLSLSLLPSLPFAPVQQRVLGESGKASTTANIEHSRHLQSFRATTGELRTDSLVAVSLIVIYVVFSRVSYLIAFVLFRVVCLYFSFLCVFFLFVSIHRVSIAHPPCPSYIPPIPLYLCSMLPPPWFSMFLHLFCAAIHSR